MMATYEESLSSGHLGCCRAKNRPVFYYLWEYHRGVGYYHASWDQVSDLGPSESDPHAGLSLHTQMGIL